MGESRPANDFVTSVWEVTPPPTDRDRPRPTLPVGYEFVAELGRGGMGVVYLVKNTRLRRNEALKMVLAGAHAERGQLTRFFTEARAAADLTHPNVAQVYETGELDGLPYFTLEYCPHGSLAERVHDGGVLDVGLATRVIERLAGAVAYAHSRGIIHRDLKPENVLFDALDEPKVTDFGLARRLDVGSSLTETAVAMGTPAYMSPEQAAGQAREAGPATDIYSLGAVLYRLLVGRPPFQGMSPSHTMWLVQQQEPVAPRQLNPATPRDLETIVLKCMQKDPAKRYPSATALANDLQAFLDGRSIAARPAGRLEKVAKWCRRRPSEAALLAGIILAFLGLVGGAFYVQAREAWSRDESRRLQDVARVSEMTVALREVEPGAVGRVLTGLAEYPAQAELLLRQALLQAAPGTQDEARTRLGLLPTDPTQAAPLARYAATASAAEVLAVRQALTGHGPAVAAALWPPLIAPQPGSGSSLGSACVLAAFTPATDPRWRGVARRVADELVRAGPLETSRWAEALRPVRAVLREPLRDLLEATRRELKGAELSLGGAELATRSDLAATVLLDYATDAPELLAQLALAADNSYYRKLLPLLRSSPGPVIAAMHAELGRAAAPIDPAGPDDQDAREALALAQANAAVTLFQLGEPAAVWPLLRHSPDPSRRSYLIRQLAGRGADPVLLLARLATEADLSAKRALILALGEYDATQLPRPLRDAVLPGFLASYRDDPDPGLHSALEWLLGQVWGQAEPVRALDAPLAAAARAGAPVTPGRGWWVNAEGQTYCVIRGPVEFTMGSEPGEPDYFNNQRPVRKLVPRDFALASKAVTVRDWQRFLAAHPALRQPANPKYAPEPDCPIIAVTWYEAAAYCRWLSEREGLPPEEMCYPEVERCVEGMTLPEDYLQRRGYRLPTEPEWEYAARAGAATSRSYGSPLDLLDRYAWHYANSDDHTHPVGRKLPNDFGLFDSLGNAWNWTGGDFSDHRSGLDTGTSIRTVVEANGRALRGGAYFIYASDLRSALRFNYRPGERFITIGLRPARTCR